ncbi:MAG TPA: hypothetical protein VF733_02785 [Candidatus Saccharimonadales bacterium]
MVEADWGWRDCAMDLVRPGFNRREAQPLAAEHNNHHKTVKETHNYV